MKPIARRVVIATKDCRAKTMCVNQVRQGIHHCKGAYLSPSGCRTAEDCPPGFACDDFNHTCIELPPDCLDDTNCMEGPCDTEIFPYTTCSYCEGG